MKYIFMKLQDIGVEFLHQYAEYSLVFLHGRGDRCDRYAPFFQHVQARVILPQAPRRSVTLSQTVQPAWYNITSVDRYEGDEENVFDFSHVRDSFCAIENIVEREVKFWKEKREGNPYQRIFVAGFSQGAVMSLYFALNYGQPIKGVCAFGGYMFRTSQYLNLSTVSFLLLHGKEDKILLEQECKKTYFRILKQGKNVKYVQVQDTGHVVTQQQVDIFLSWMQENWNKKI